MLYKLFPKDDEKGFEEFSPPEIREVLDRLYGLGRNQEYFRKESEKFLQ